jgi:hypothetical protein
MNRQLFFCFGPPKSGTTLLQRILDLHPEISCPPEHQLDFLNRQLSELLTQYDKILKVVDHRTGGQGTTPSCNTIHSKLFRYTVESLIWESAREKKIAGANDNAIISKIERYNTLFDSPKFIVIFRHPIESAISAWHHNMKLAIEENNPQHKLTMTRHGGMEDWIKYIASRFSIHVHAYMNFQESHENILMLRYEDLVNDKKACITRLFDYLSASTRDQILSQIIEQSSFDAMKKAATRKEFFRSGSIDRGKSFISSDLRSEIERTASDALQMLGYISVQ